MMVYKFFKTKVPALIATILFISTTFVACGNMLDLNTNNIKKKAEEKKESSFGSKVPLHRNQSVEARLLETVENFSPAQDNAYKGFRFNTEDLSKYFNPKREDLNIEIGTQLPVKIFNNDGKQIHNLTWYFVQRNPIKKIFTKEQTQDNTNNSIIEIQDGKILAKNKGFGHLIAVYTTEDGKEYIQKMNIDITEKNNQNELQEAVDKKVSEIMKDVVHLSDFGKVKYIHDYLANNMTYKMTYSGNPNPYYNALIKKEGVCDGYAWAFLELTQELGIQSERMTGYAGQQYHAWNRLKLDDGWYYLDATWDDKDSGLSHDYFLVTKDVIKKDHNINNDNKNPGKKYSTYPFVKDVDFADNMESLDKVMKNQVDLLENGKIVTVLTSTNISADTVYDYFDKYTPNYVNTTRVPGTSYRNYNLHKIRVRFSVSPKYKDVKFSVKAVNNSVGNTEKLEIKLNQDVELGVHNIDIKNAEKESLKRISLNTYELKIYDIQSSQKVSVNIAKTGYHFYMEPNSQEIDVNLVKADTPNVQFTGVSFNTGKFSGVQDGDMYNIGDGNWIKAENNKEINVIIGSYILLKRVENGKVNSDYQKIVFREQDFPNWITVNNKVVTGLNSKMEFKNKYSGNWEDVDSNTLTLLPGTYEFRFKGRQNVLGSDAYEVIVQ